MAQYIDKDVLIAEIEKWRDEIKKAIFSIPLTGSDKSYATFEYEILGRIKDFLDTLDVKEVKEVNLDMEINLWVRNLHRVPNFEELNKFARHFFELGLKAQKGE